MANKILKQKQALTAIQGDLTFGADDVWLWSLIPPAQFDFQDGESRERSATNFDLMLKNALSSEEKALECHLIVSSRPFDTLDWVQKVYQRGADHNAPAYQEDYLKGMFNRVEDIGFREQLVLLGIKIGIRAEYSASRAAAMLGPLSSFLGAVSGGVDEYISDKEYKFWNSRAKGFRNSLYASRARARAATAEEIAYAVRRNFYPAMPSPDADSFIIGDTERWGIGELAALVDAEIENRPKWLKMCQVIDGEEYTGYRATLCFNRFPPVLEYPRREPWIHYASTLNFSTDFYSRFTLEPSRKVRKEVNVKIKETEDQAHNQTSAGGSLAMETAEYLQLGKELDYALGKDSNPWVFGRHRMIVEADSEDQLKERVQQVIDLYKDLDIYVEWPTGDQFNLLLESLPNDKVRLRSYYQRQELSILSCGAPTGSGTVGDVIERLPDGSTRGWKGPYFGYTTGYTIEPVLFSPHSVLNRDKAPGTVIVGSPGGGKSFSAFTLAYQMALQGVWTIYIDPKGDGEQLPTLPGMEKSRYIDLKDGHDGLLDPFSMGEVEAERLELAVETIIMLVGGYRGLEPSARTGISDAVNKVSQEPNPSLYKVVDEMLRSNDPHTKALGSELSLTRRLAFARLCFNPNTGQQDRRLRSDEGLTLITLRNLQLPGLTTPQADYTTGERLAVAVMYLLSQFTLNLMRGVNKSQPKAILIDEAWSITSTSQGKRLIETVSRLGRSLNTALVLVSQNAGDFLDGPVLNSVSTRLVFRSENTVEVDNAIKMLELPVTDALRDTIRNLGRGECLMMDASRRVARIKIDNWDRTQNIAYESNPEARKKNEAR